MDDTTNPLSQDFPIQNSSSPVHEDPISHDNTFGGVPPLQPQVSGEPIASLVQNQQASIPIPPPGEQQPTEFVPPSPIAAPSEQGQAESSLEQTPSIDITNSPDVFRREIASPQSGPSDQTILAQQPLSGQQQPPQSPNVQAYEDEEEGGLPKPIKFGLIGGAVLVGLLIIFGLFTFFAGIFSHGGTKVTLAYWGLWEDPSVMQSIIADFEKQNPDITINYSKQDPKEYSQRLLTRIANGTGPDIFRYHNTWVPMLSSVLTPLPTSVITPENFTKTYFPIASSDLVQNGAIIGIPLEIDTLALFTNNQLLQKAGIKPPSTWQDFIADAKALTVKDQAGKIQIAGVAMGTYDNVTHAPDIMSLLFAQNQANMKDLASTTQNASDALTFYTTFASGDNAVWDSSLDPSMTAFSKGVLGMYFGYSWDIFSIKALNPSLDFTVSPVPHLPGGQSMTVASYWVEGVSSKSKNQKAAMLFMQYLTRKDVLQKLYSEEVKTRTFGEPYAQKDLATSLKSNPLVAPFVNQADHATSAFFAGETQDTAFNGPVNTYLAAAIDSVLTNTSADSAIATLAQGVNQVLQKYAVH